MEVERRPRGADAAIAALADLQHGVVARAQLIELGLGRQAIGRRLERGRLHPLHRGVYAVGHRALSGHGRWMAAVLAGGPSAVLSHRSAAALWGIRASVRARIDITTAPPRRSRRGIQVHGAVLAADEVTAVSGIPVTTTSRTLLDLAAVATPRQVERALAEAEVLRLADAVSLGALVSRHRGRAGVAPIRRLLERGRFDAAITRSELEDRFLALLDANGLPHPQVNRSLRLRSGRFVEADCVWPEPRLIVELDGYASHGTRTAFERDRARDRALQAAGWRIVRITWRQLHEQPAALGRELRELVAPRRR